MAVHLAVAGDVFDSVLFCAVLFSPQEFLDETWDLNESVPENFLSYFFFDMMHPFRTHTLHITPKTHTNNGYTCPAITII